ncbi:MAG TPA: acyl carrier protein [Methylomirabilota bacterium]|jgi:acyl carrier protein|nr:acyl carrier protein [Methylomirabilota bacterium]
MQDALTLHQRITRLFVEHLNVDIASFDTDLLNTGILDSLQFVELLLRLENEFGLTVSLDDLEIDFFRSIDTIAAFVANRERPTG